MEVVIDPISMYIYVVIVYMISTYIVHVFNLTDKLWRDEEVTHYLKENSRRNNEGMID